MKTNLLVVEDDDNLRFGIVFNLEREGYRVVEARTGEEGLEHLERETFEGVLLDVMLPGMSGFDVLRALQNRPQSPRVLVLSARSDESDAVTALTLGAEDYVRKPFGLSELIARLRVILRRPAEAVAETSHLGTWQLDLQNLRAHEGNRQITLTTIETDLLRELLTHRGQVCRREDLLERVWGVGSETPTRTLDNHVARLRKKLDREGHEGGSLIQTVHSVGYRVM